ncbi:MAG: hypothetical protein LBM71_05980 [Elusimicrobiota bacterium]|nr:hypothetical protein [Elusimicrobiota bacterium]
MPKSDILEEILINLLALDKGFEDYEFFHCFLGEREYLKKASLIKFEDAYLFLKHTLTNLDSFDINDTAPYYRKTYIKDLLVCVITQVEKFVYKKKISFSKVETALSASSILPPFDIAWEFAVSDTKIRELTGLTTKEFRRQKNATLNGFKEIKKYSQKIIDDNLQKALEYSPFFKQFNLKTIINKMDIHIVNKTPNNSPCFFKYDGNYCATMGLLHTNNVQETAINAFVLHEGVPGHFLYYCIKQYLADRGQGDKITLLDTFYSPENCINEGLAVCSYLVFDKLVSSLNRATIEVEKILHKIFYNLWYDVNIKHMDTKLERELLKLFNILPSANRLIKYFTKDEKYYAPYYPLGIYYGENIIPKIKKENLGFLYQQHSVNTLKKLIKEQK